MPQIEDPELRETAFRVCAGSSTLVIDLQTDAVVRVLKAGLQDTGECEFCVFLRLFIIISANASIANRSISQLLALHILSIIIRCILTRPIVIAPLSHANLYPNPNSQS